MNRTRSITACVIVAAASVAACSSSKSVVGTWTVMGQRGPTSQSVEFKPDGTAILTERVDGKPRAVTGSYQRSGGSMTISTAVLPAQNGLAVAYAIQMRHWHAQHPHDPPPPPSSTVTVSTSFEHGYLVLDPHSGSATYVLSPASR